MPPPDYRFEPLTRADLPLMRRWLAQPHVRAWWGDPGAEIALIEPEIGRGPTDMRLVWTVGERARPFAYVQDYQQIGDLPQFAGLPSGTRAIDTLIGEPDCLGRGHAPRYLRQRARELLAAGAPMIVIDPEPHNRRAVAAFRRAGFAGDRVVPSETGNPVLVLSWRGSQLSDAA